MKHGKDVLDSELNQCFVLITFSLKKTKQAKQPQTKNPWAAQFPSFRCKGNYGDWGGRSDVTISRRSSAHSAHILQSRLRWGCQETFHSKRRTPAAKAAAQGEPWSSARGLAAPGRHHLRALLTHSPSSAFDSASPGLKQQRCRIWGNL